MKSILRFAGGLLPIVVLAFGCSNGPTGPGLSADEQAIRQLVEEDTEMFGLAGYDDDGAQPPVYDPDFGKVGTLIEPMLFGRRGRPRLEDVDVTLTSDSTAIATVTHSFDGNFFILARNPDQGNAVATLYKKEMQNRIYRRIKLKKVADTGNDRHDWKITDVSMRQGGAPETTIKVEVLTIDLPEREEDIVVADPLEYFFNREQGIPTFSPGDTVKVFVNLSNSNSYEPKPGETVLLRYKMDHRILRARRTLNDDGLYPDAHPGDGVYSGYWVIGHRRALFHAAVDIFDNGTLYDDSEPYNSVFWSMPYRVRR